MTALPGLIAPGLAVTDSVIDAIDLAVNGANAGAGALRGQAYTVMFADAIFAQQDFASAASPIPGPATAAATSSSWFGTAASFGFVLAPAPVIAAAATSGAASARAVSGIGLAAPVTSGPFTSSLLAHLATLAVDPVGGSASASLRAYLRPETGQDIEFWSARVEVGTDPDSHEPRLSVEDPAGLLTASQFDRFMLPGGRGGFTIGGAGLDLVIPVPDLSAFSGQPIEIRLETRHKAASDAFVPAEKDVILVADEIRQFTTEALPEATVPEVSDRLYAVADQLDKPEVPRIGLALEMLREGRDAAAKYLRADVVNKIIGFRRRLAGVTVEILDIPRVSLVDDALLAQLELVRFRINADDPYRATCRKVELTVNGRRPKRVTRGVDRSGDAPPGEVIQTLRWSFDDAPTRCSCCAAERLGLTSGRNHIVLSVRTEAGEVLGVADLVVLLPAAD
jgi:hypothetical protein